MENFSGIFLHKNVNVKKDQMILLYFFRVERNSCYMIRADEIFNQVSQDSSGKGASQGMFIGCSLDTATGTMTFTCDGKPTNYIYKVKNATMFNSICFISFNTKLY
jgi:ryanodine receptor 2